MSAEGGLTTTGYIQHHLTNLVVCSDAAKDVSGHCHGFWSFHLDTLLVSGLLGLIVFGLMAKVASKASAGVPGGLQVQDHVGTALGLFDLLDLELARALAGPAHALGLVGAGAATFHRDAVGHDEARVEADAELTDQVGVALLAFVQVRQKVARAALGDGAQMRDRLFGAHADAVVADGQGARLLVQKQADLQVRRVLEQCGVVQRLEAQLVAGIAGVGNQLAQEDFLVRVQAVGDQMQDLLDFGLEGVGVLGAHGV